jgi:hypothetical protein
MPGVQSEALALTKWYVDCCDASGRTVIGYWASLSWRGLVLTWHSVTLFQSGRSVSQRSSLARVPAPAIQAGEIAWQAPALRCAIRAEIRQPPFGARLLETEEGAVDWRCEAPVALVAVELDGRPPIRGPGYAERIVLTVLPWRLPIRELRWGRWLDHDARRSVVWIDWRGPPARTWVFVDGAQVPGAKVTDRGVAVDGLSLSLDRRWTLEAHRPGEIVRSIPPLKAVVPASILALDGTKWCSSGRLREGGFAPLAGQAIHELVMFA